MDMLDQINRLMQTNPDFEPLWIEDHFGKLHLKRDTLYGPARSIGIISVDFHKHLQKRGRFTELLTLLEQWAEKLGTNVLVQQTQERYLAQFLEKRGYQRIHPTSKNWISKPIAPRSNFSPR